MKPIFAARDADGAALPVLRLRPGGAHKVILSAASTRIGFPTGTRVISVHSSVDCWIATGGETVVADETAHHLPVGAYLVLSLGDDRHGGAHTHLAAVQSDAAGKLYVSELE